MMIKLHLITMKLLTHHSIWQTTLISIKYIVEDSLEGLMVAVDVEVSRCTSRNFALKWRIPGFVQREREVWSSQVSHLGRDRLSMES